jgi:hypothetical protein
MPNIAPGASAEYFMIGWTGSSTRWDAAVASGAFVGASAIVTTATGNPLTTPPETPVSLSSTFQGMTFPGCLGYDGSYHANASFPLSANVVPKLPADSPVSP